MLSKKPGVADNKSYKDMYHFKDNFFSKDSAPSLNVDPDINDSIKENPYKSNVEIEGGEIVLKPDMTALFRAVGKKHSGGGMDVHLQPNSFIFSDDKSLAITEYEKKKMEFKTGGNYTPEKNTPAQIVKKNVDPKHYNTLINNINDVEKDDLAKRSSTRMLEKYIGVLGNIAYLQEKKKDFPDGLPEFSNGTAPVFDGDLKDEIMEQKQYLRKGGNVKAQMDSFFRGPLPSDSYLTPTTEEAIAAQQQYSGVPPVNPYSGVPPLTPYPYKHLREATKGSVRMTTVSPQPETVYTPAVAPVPGEVDGVPGVKTADWQFTPWQKLSQGYNALKWASAKRYMPYRSQLNASFVDPALVNPEQVIGDLKGNFNAQVNAAGSALSPILRNAQTSSAYGELLDKIPGVRSQYDNQNVGIKNQFAQYNNQIANNQRAVNMQNDQQYYKESVVGQQNFDNMRTFLADQTMNNVLRDVETNQSLAYNLLTQNNPAWNFDWRTGNFTRTNKDIRDVQGNGAGDELKGVMDVINTIPDPYDKAKALTKLYGLKVFGPAISQQKKMGGYLRPKK